MKTGLAIAAAALMLALSSCDNSRADQNSDTSISDTTLNRDIGNRIDFDKTKVLKTVYVTDKKGSSMKERADQSSPTLGTLEFGQKLDVIEEGGKWYGIRYRISRETVNSNGNITEISGWEKVYVLKSACGKITDIRLLPADLNIISSLTLRSKTEDFDTDYPLKEYLKIELIDKRLFDSRKSTRVNYLLADTNAVKKKNGVLGLNCEKKLVKYIDKPDAEDEMEVYDYVGQFDFLNKFMIRGSYWESYDHKLIDKTSGEETATLIEYPYISPDKKHIICIYSNPYNSTADLELYSISAYETSPVMGASFKYWMPTVETGDMFFSTDGYFYFTANHAYVFWKDDGSLNDNYQYLRIKIL